MKDVVINLAAAWGATGKVWQDGDVFTEANNDTLLGVILDRIGYLKTTVDTKAGAASNMVWTGTHAFTGSPSVTINPTLLAIAPASGTTDIAGAVIATGTVEGSSLTTTGAVVADGGVAVPALILSDADQTVAHTAASVFRVPALTANRVYTLSNPVTNGVEVKFTRRGSEAFTATIRRADTTTLGVINASNPGTIVLRSWGGKWLVEDFSANTSSLNTDVS